MQRRNSGTVRRFALLLIATLLATGCAASRNEEPLRIAAASDLRQALPRLIDRFKALHNIDVEPTFGASGQLAQQIRQGAPFDLFFSANRTFVSKLADEGLVKKDSTRDYAQGTLVLALSKGCPDVKTLADLSDSGIKHIALANPELAPYGAAGKQALERAKLWAELSRKIAQAETVAQAFQFVKTGNAEVALVGKTLTLGEDVRVVPIDPELYDPIIQAMGIVARSERSGDAEAFAQFVLSDEGRAILREQGFTDPRP